MTINEIVTNILNLKSGGIRSDDDSFSKRQMIFIVNYIRAKLIKEALDRKQEASREWVQDLGCVLVQSVDKAECCDIKTNCFVLRTVDKIPAPVRSKLGNTITYVGRVDKGEVFPLERFHRHEWQPFDKWTSNVQVSYYHNGYLYVTKNNILSHINVHGIFENPMEVSRYNVCDSSGTVTGQTCYEAIEDDYPVDIAMVDTITEIAMKREALYQVKMPQDLINDSVDDTKTEANS